MPDMEKFVHVMTCLNDLIERNAIEPLSALDKEAFYYEMLLLRGSSETITPSWSGYKMPFITWLSMLKKPWMITPNDNFNISVLWYL